MDCKGLEATHQQMRAKFQRQVINQSHSHFNEKFQVKSVHQQMLFIIAPVQRYYNHFSCDTALCRINVSIFLQNVKIIHSIQMFLHLLPLDQLNQWAYIAFPSRWCLTISVYEKIIVRPCRQICQYCFWSPAVSDIFFLDLFYSIA